MAHAGSGAGSCPEVDGEDHDGGQTTAVPTFFAQFKISLLQDGVVIGDGTCYELSAEGCTVAIQAT